MGGLALVLTQPVAPSLALALAARRPAAQPLGVQLLVGTIVLGLIALELWWFLGPHEEAAEARADGVDGRQTIEILVDGGYSPARVQARAGLPIRLVFLRRDPSDCLARVVFPDARRSLDLPLHRSVSLDLPPQPPGRYPFHCGMAMVRGELVVLPP